MSSWVRAASSLFFGASSGSQPPPPHPRHIRHSHTSPASSSSSSSASSSPALASTTFPRRSARGRRHSGSHGSSSSSSSPSLSSSSQHRLHSPSAALVAKSQLPRFHALSLSSSSSASSSPSSLSPLSLSPAAPSSPRGGRSPTLSSSALSSMSATSLSAAALGRRSRSSRSAITPSLLRKSTITLPWCSFFEEEVHRLAMSTSQCPPTPSSGAPSASPAGPSASPSTEFFSLGRMLRTLHTLDPHIRTDCFTFDSVGEAQLGKSCLLSLWSILLKRLPSVPSVHRALWYEYLLCLMNRYEFDLVHFELTENIRLDDDVDPVDLRLARTFRQNFVDTVKVAAALMQDVGDAERLAHDPQFRHRRSFCLQTLAAAFFRFPVICAPILDAVCAATSRHRASHPGHNPFVPLPEDESPSRSPRSPSAESRAAWQAALLDRIDAVSKRLTMASQSAVSSSGSFLDMNPSLFQWCVFDDAEPDSAALRACLPVLRMLARDALFFEFLMAVLAHVDSTAHGFVRWDLVPGYFDLVKCFFKRTVAYVAPHPPIVVACMDALLENRALFPALVELVVCTTPSHDKMAINQMFAVLDKWMKQVSSTEIAPDAMRLTASAARSASNMQLQHSYSVLFEALDILLDSDHFQILIRTLCFIYTHVGRFDLHRRRHLLQDMLLGKHFMRFFCHWCPEVRRVLHLILAFRLRRQGPRIRRMANGREKTVPPPTRNGGVSTLAVHPVNDAQRERERNSIVKRSLRAGVRRARRISRRVLMRLNATLSYYLGDSDADDDDDVDDDDVDDDDDEGVAAEVQAEKQAVATTMAVNKAAIKSSQKQKQKKHQRRPINRSLLNKGQPAPAPTPAPAPAGRPASILSMDATPNLGSPPQCPVDSLASPSLETPLESCIEVVTTRGPEDILLDKDLSHLLAERVQQIEEQLEQPGQRLYFSPALLPYAHEALRELRAQLAYSHRLQQQAERGGVVTPQLFFEIPSDVDDPSPAVPSEGVNNLHPPVYSLI